MKKLPKIYQNDISKEINNNKKSSYVSLEPIKNEKEEQDITLDEIFTGLGYSYNIPLIIKTKNDNYHTSLIAKIKNNVITIDNEIIPISEIISIKRKKN